MNTNYDYGSLVRLLIPAISPQFPSEVIFVAGVILWQHERQVNAGEILNREHESSSVYMENINLIVSNIQHRPDILI